MGSGLGYKGLSILGPSSAFALPVVAGLEQRGTYQIKWLRLMALTWGWGFRGGPAGSS